MEQFIQNMLIGIRQWVNEKISGVNEAIDNKQDTLTAGENIEITSGGTISVTGIIDDSVIGNNSTYSSSKITNLISTIAQLSIEVVDELPESGDTHTMYLVPAQESGETNSRDEYLWIVDASTGVGTWELIGTTKTDLSDYYIVTEVNALLDDKQDTLTAGDNIEITSGGTISVTGVTSATEQALEDMSYVISSHINELNTKVDGKQDEVNVTVEEVLEVLNDSDE